MADVSAESHANLQQAATDGGLLLSDLQRWRFRSNVFFGRVLCPSCSNESGRYDAQDFFCLYFCIFCDAVLDDFAALILSSLRPMMSHG